ncbi:uncharacterized protein Dana_GF19139 [Drosophila ananassae]|uniref:Uncharacterized protein n=1 Tax=Drosophila ananassae TaxID=7217 RepID=B3MZE7_DROAN|nr:uncharacterized protein LOC6501901 [Drosophila ananassae]EDV33748.1 uncharacterized protein Dana_GF19139 [Drosophila ananassae]
MTNSMAVLFFLGLCLIGQLQAAAIVCGSEAKSAAEEADATTPSPSEVNKFVLSVQCTLEKAKPWIANIEKEAKLLEEKARDVTRSLFQRFNILVSVLTQDKDKNKDKDMDTDKHKDQEEVSSTTDISPSPSTPKESSPKEELTTSAPPVPMDWLEDQANEVDFVPETTK